MTPSGHRREIDAITEDAYSAADRVLEAAADSIPSLRETEIRHKSDAAIQKLAEEMSARGETTGHLVAMALHGLTSVKLHASAEPAGVLERWRQRRLMREHVRQVQRAERSLLDARKLGWAGGTAKTPRPTGPANRPDPP
ncbi:hypothetical protein [Actinomadura sp. WMMB 499]|uniref:hypothetical protein n=1 Tax=Actinomadura sp. WMMB 499 TaxID=1219491 RepID=UPI001245176C|nr:hypothetical protein [Actinomadura sp. WMMB 499]QFG24928.1 hypothetical protein F7P10_31125 [Actinomadura sp. WMMB 499]